jgi:ABC-type glycerol-3-phosphate transport system substrate-binding protein
MKLLSERHWRFHFLVLVSLCLGLLLAACGDNTATPAAGSTAGSPAAAGSATTAAAGDPNAPITVWVDDTRKAAVTLFQQKFPDQASRIKIEVVDRGAFPGKVLLFNNTGKGWPDVVFAEPNLVAQVADPAHNYPLDLTPYVSADIKSKFAGLDDCTFDGKLFCLRNDLAQNVLWYNKKLMDQFGYTVPKTWEDYTALGLKVAKEHPGYVIGAVGDNQAVNMYFGGSNCPLQHALTNSQVLINTADPNCTRVATMLDTLIAAKAVSNFGPFDPDFVKLGTDNKILMLPAASWYGEYVFKATYYKANITDSSLGVAEPPKWASDSKTYTAAQGGAAWTVYRNTKNPKLATDLALWLTTANDYQATAPTFPAYIPAADAWHATVQNDKLYATDPYPALKASAAYLYPEWSQVRYDVATSYAKIVNAGLKDGKTVASLMDAFQKDLVPLAGAQGYEVVTKAP